jgi:SAM-dependent methyltransferase
MQGPGSLNDVTGQMQHDWNERAREDAHFYVAFGRREQDDEEFFATATEVVRGLEWELRRLPPRANRRAWRALEIGCGPGRLMKPMSASFGEIHGVDVSDEMIARARANLAGISHAHVHHTSGADLAPFADRSFDFVYSYAVFQHIPSREVVMQYLREAQRVLKPGGLLRAQLNGLDASARKYDTWSGVRIGMDEVRQFAREFDMQLLALEGVRTQYMWTTMRKRGPGWSLLQRTSGTRIRRITNAHNSEPVAPARGRFASVTLWVDLLPADCELNTLEIAIGGTPAFACYIGPPEVDGLQQVNVILPRLARTGLLPVSITWNSQEVCEPRYLRVIPPAPAVPVVTALHDGINMLSGTRIVSGVVKVSIEETDAPETFHATVGGRPVRNMDIFCADPMPPRYEINFHLPEGLGPGEHELDMRLASRHLGSQLIDVGGG